MFTIKIYAEGSIFIRSCNQVHILKDNNPTYADACKDMAVAYREPEAELSDAELMQMMPYAFIYYDWNGVDSEWLLHGNDRAYIVNDSGSTIEAINPPTVIRSSFEVEE